AYLVNDDNFGHVVFHRLDHHRVLAVGVRHLHPSRSPNRGVRDVAVARDFVGRVHDNHALVHLVREHAGTLTQQGGLSYARRADKEYALARLDEVFDDGDGAVHCPPNTAGQAHNIAATVANAGYAVQGALYSGAVVAAELAYAVNNE